MKRLAGLVLLAWVLILFGSLLSCKTMTPFAATSGSPQTASPVSPAPPGEPQAVIKPADPPTIWWGPKPTTAEDFMRDMEKYYPDWYRWFSVHPEDIASCFSPLLAVIDTDSAGLRAGAFKNTPLHIRRRVTIFELKLNDGQGGGGDGKKRRSEDKES